MRSNRIILTLFLFTLLLVIISSSSTTKEHNTTPYPFGELKSFPPLPKNDNTPTIEGVALGRQLFYDSILSLNNTISCGSCHKQEFAFADASKQFSTGINGKKLRRNTLPLFNLGWYNNLFWDGKATSIEEQVFHPVTAHNEMNLSWELATKRIQASKKYRKLFYEAFGKVTIDSNLIAKAIGQFERTLISNNSKYDRVLRGDAYFTADEYEGFVIINEQSRGDCLHCHTSDADALGTIVGFSNNGLSNSTRAVDYSDKGRAEVTGDSNDIGKFKIPSLRNVAVTAPYMHDGRFETLEEVLNFYSEGVNLSYNIDAKMGYAHQGGIKLSKKEKEQVIAFLHTLTDHTFLSNPSYSNPYN